MISETDRAVFDKLDGIKVRNKLVAIKFVGHESEFVQNVKITPVSPWYNIQRYDMSFARDARWMPQEEITEFNYIAGTAKIKGPDYPLYLWYQIDCMSRYQRDQYRLIESVLQLMPTDGYLNINADGKSHVCAYVQTESVPLDDYDDEVQYRHAFRYRINVRLKNLNEQEYYLVKEIVLKEYGVDNDELIRELIYTEDD